MKRILLIKSVTFIVFIFLISFNSKDGYGQPCIGSQITVTMDSLVQPTPNTIEFVVTIKNTGTTILKIASFPGGFTYPANLIPSGTTMTASILSHPNDLDFPALNDIGTLVHQSVTKQIRWTNNPPVNEVNSVNMPSNINMLVLKMKLTLNGGVWPTNFPLQLTWNQGLPVNQYSQVSPLFYCNGNLNSAVLSESHAGTMILVNAPGIVLNPIPNPVSYTSFTGSKTDQVNILEWTTGSEQNCSHFNLQKSVDGYTYSSIGKINSKSVNGQSTIELGYDFVDRVPNIGHNYYRLEQVDLDGKSNMSKVIDIVRSNTENTITLFPNPTTDILNAEFIFKKQALIEIRVNHGAGKNVKTVQAKADIGTSTIQIDMKDLPIGTYNIVVYENLKKIYTKQISKN